MDVAEDTFVNPVTRTPRIETAGTRREGSGTSIADASYVHRVMFVNTEAVEDTRAGGPPSRQDPPMNQEGLSTTRSRDTATTLGEDLLSARSSNSSAPSLGWLDSKGQSSNRFSVVQIPFNVDAYNLICLREISSGTTVCIKKNCTTNHRGRETATIRCGEILVQKSANEAFLYPSTHGNNITDEVLTYWLSSRRRLNEWSVEFAIANGVQHHEVLSTDDLMHATAFTVDAREHKSPGLLNVSRSERANDTLSNLLYHEFGNDRFGARKRTLSDEEFDEEGNRRRRLGEEQGAADISDPIKFDKLDDAITHIYSLLEFITSKLDEKDQALTEEVKILFSRIEVAQTELGKPSTNRTDRLQVPTIWGSIASIAEIIEEMQAALQLVPSSENMKRFLVTEFEKIEDGANNTVSLIIQDLQKNISDILRKSKDKDLDNKGAIESLKDTLEATQNNTDDVLFRLAEGSAILKDEIADVRRLVSSGSIKNVSASSGTSNCSNYVSIPTFRSRMLIVDADLESIRASIQKLVSETDGESIKSFGLGFKDRRASESWAATNLVNDLGKLPFGLIVDAHLVFEHIYHMTSDNSECLTNFCTLKKLELSNMTQSLCIQSFETRLPKILTKSSMVNSSKFTKAGVSHFDKASNFLAWDDPSIGLKEIIKDNLTTFRNTHQELIDATTEPNTSVRLLATTALQTSILWIETFMAFVDDTYKGFTRQNTFSEDKAWELTTQLGKRVFWEVSTPRMGVVTSISVGNNDLIARVVFWPMLRGHDVMKAFQDARFRDHPTIAGEYVKFMTANSGSEIVGQALTKLKRMEEDVTTALKLAKQAAAKADSAMNLVDALRKQIEKEKKDQGNKRN